TTRSAKAAKPPARGRGRTDFPPPGLPGWFNGLCTTRSAKAAKPPARGRGRTDFPPPGLVPVARRLLTTKQAPRDTLHRACPDGTTSEDENITAEQPCFDGGKPGRGRAVLHALVVFRRVPTGASPVEVRTTYNEEEGTHVRPSRI